MDVSPSTKRIAGSEAKRQTQNYTSAQSTANSKAIIVHSSAATVIPTIITTTSFAIISNAIIVNIGCVLDASLNNLTADHS